MAAGVQKTQSVPSCCLRTKTSSGRSKQIDFPGKRKRAAMSVDADSSNRSEVSSLNEPAFSRSPAKCKNRKSHFVKNILLKSTCGGVLQLMEAAALPRHDSPLPEEYLNSSHENEKNNCSSVGLSSSYSAHSPVRITTFQLWIPKRINYRWLTHAFSWKSPLLFLRKKVLCCLLSIT